MNSRLLTIILGCAATLAVMPSTADVYTWKGSSGNPAYSDVPHKLQPSRSGIVNIRTRTVTPPEDGNAENVENADAEQSEAEKKRKSEEQNKKIEEQNKKIEEDNRQMKAENCKAARMNRQFAESARTDNRAALIQRYDADISRFCN